MLGAVWQTEIQSVRKNFSLLNSTARIRLSQRPGILSFCFGRLGCFEFRYCKVTGAVLVIQQTAPSSFSTTSVAHFLWYTKISPACRSFIYSTSVCSDSVLTKRCIVLRLWIFSAAIILHTIPLLFLCLVFDHVSWILSLTGNNLFLVILFCFHLYSSSSIFQSLSFLGFC